MISLQNRADDLNQVTEEATPLHLFVLSSDVETFAAHRDLPQIRLSLFVYRTPDKLSLLFGLAYGNGGCFFYQLVVVPANDTVRNFKFFTFTLRGHH